MPDKTRILMLLVCVCCLLVPVLVRAEFEDTISKSFQVAENGTLSIKSDLGSIQVKAAGTNSVQVEITRTVRVSSKNEAEEVLKDLQLEFHQNGNDVQILAKYNRDRIFGGWRKNPLSLKFMVSVPVKYNVDLHTSGGSITVDDLQGRVDSETSGGSLSFGHITGPVNGETSGGSIRLAACNGNAHVETSGGGIDIGQVQGRVEANTSGGSISIDQAQGEVTAETSGGGIQVNEVMGSINASTSGGPITAHISKQPQGPCSLETSGGSIHVTLSSDIKVDVEAATSGGSVRSDLPITIQGEMNHSHIQGKINGGGPVLHLETSGGSISISKDTI